MFVSAIIVAAGSSSRMGQPKLLLPLGGKPVLWHTLRAFDCAAVDELVLVARQEDIPAFRELAQDAVHKPLHFATGGNTRQQSVRNGLAMVSPEASLLAIADGARPLCTPAVIDAVIAQAAQTGAAAAAVRVKDTIQQTDELGNISATPDRRFLWQVQTPQVFERTLYERAMAAADAAGADYTDDCQSVRAIGAPVRMVEADYANIKITTPDDLPAAAALLRRRDDKGGAAMRIGHGYDVHRLVEGRALILGGVRIPYEKGLLGHSDADVLAHACADALLGAAACGDIGKLFPDSDARFENADSLLLLRQVGETVRAAGYAIQNLDATVLAQAPKLAPHILQMRENLAAALDIPADFVSVKATTEEGLGFTGTGDGIAAHAVTLLERI